MDDHKYSRFESTIICPSIRATHYCNALFANSFLTELPITFALGCQSIVDTKCFLVNTNYNHLPINIHPPSPEPHHSVLISDSNVDNIVTLDRLRHASRCPADDT